MIFTKQEVEKILTRLPHEWEMVLRYRCALWVWNTPEPMLSIAEVARRTGMSYAAVSYRIKTAQNRILHCFETERWFAKIDEEDKKRKNHEYYLLRHPHKIKISWQEEIHGERVLPTYYSNQIERLGAATLGELATFSPQKLQAKGMTKKGIRAVVNLLKKYKVPYPFRVEPMNDEEIVDQWQEAFTPHESGIQHYLNGKAAEEENHA